MSNQTTKFSIDIISENDLRSFNKVLIITLILLATIVTILNFAIILIYKRMHFNQKSVSNYLLFSTALADFYIAVITWYELAEQVVPGGTHHVVHILYKGLLEYSYILSLANLFLCALERLVSYSGSHAVRCLVKRMKGALVPYSTLFFTYTWFFPRSKPASFDFYIHDLEYSLMRWVQEGF